MLSAAACFGVAGPVIDGRCVTTNLPWVVEEAALAGQTGIAAVRLLNDLQAMALGLARLPAEELVELNPDARPRAGNVAVIAAGTGCGEAMLYWDGHSHHAIATEGGHADFAPNSREQEGLLRWLRGKFGGHVSYERVLSGPGLFNVYQYLREEGVAAESAEFREALLAGTTMLVDHHESPGLIEGSLDVLAEEARVSSGAADADSTIVVSGLRKVYRGGKYAVKGFSLGQPSLSGGA